MGGLLTAATLPEMLRTTCIALPSRPCLLAAQGNPCVGTRPGWDCPLDNGSDFRGGIFIGEIWGENWLIG